MRSAYTSGLYRCIGCHTNNGLLEVHLTHSAHSQSYLLLPDLFLHEQAFHVRCDAFLLIPHITLLFGP